MGRSYPTQHSAKKYFAPLITVPRTKPPHLLSFINLVECHILSAIRRFHSVPLKNVRGALAYLNEQMPSAHPLVDQTFETDGIDLFIEAYDQLINVSQQGQTVMRDIMSAYLQRVDRDQQGKVLRLFPLTRTTEPTAPQIARSPRIIVIDPFVAFGKQTIAGSGIPTAVIADRYKTGESIGELAEDYDRPIDEIEEAIRSELAA